MTNTPPTDRPTTAGDVSGAGVDLTPTEARGGQRTGRAIWILVISLAAIVILFAGLWAMNAGRMQAINHPAGRDLNARDVSTFQTPPPSARQAPPGEPSTTGNTGG